MLEPPLLQPTCGNCRHWGCMADGGMHRTCLEPNSLRETGERLRAMWEGCSHWATLRLVGPPPSVPGSVTSSAAAGASDGLFGRLSSG